MDDNDMEPTALANSGAVEIEYCSRCGYMLEVEWNYCSECGHRVIEPKPDDKQSEEYMI